MSLLAGDKLGPYEVLAPIGAGGMGEVYRARDPRLGREVAIKVSVERFSERFDREARAIASLNHSNICHLYDVGPNYLVMELIEGPTLADRLRQGAIPLEEALHIAGQIAEALEAAHEKGITHRDLKPGNVKIRPDGSVKVLDFGLAKIGGTPRIESDNSPTITIGQTEAGVILGTASYMSPEQAKGKPVDQRADIYAFGVVVYEMLTRTRLHKGETTTEVLASVIKEEPNWEKVPPSAQRLLRRCLEKDPQKRLRHIGDVMSLVDEPPVQAEMTRRPGRQIPWLRASIGVAIIGVAAALTYSYFRAKPTALPAAVRFEISQPSDTTFSGVISISPDGRRLAFVVQGLNGTPLIWIRSLETLESRPLDGTESVSGIPFWSPDSRYLVFWAAGKVKRIEAFGGPAQTLCDMPAVVSGGMWARDNKVIFGVFGGGIFEVPAGGGTASEVAKQGAFPSLLPDGSHFVYMGWGDQNPAGGIYLGSLDSKLRGRAVKRLLTDDSPVVYVPSPDPAVGYLLFVRRAVLGAPAGTLMAQAFDIRRLELTGDSVAIADQVPVVSLTASSNGVLVYGTGSPVTTGGARGQIQGQLTWFDGQGKVLATVGEPGYYRSLALSPDGKKVAVERTDPQTQNRDIWLLEFDRGRTTRFTFDAAWEADPVWSPDGSYIAFASNRAGRFDLYQKPANGVGDDELLYKSQEPKGSTSWSPDGRFLLYFNLFGGSRVWMLPMGRGKAASSDDRKPISLIHSDFVDADPHFSPDGRWIAYTSNESGKAEIYVRPFEPPPAGSPAENGQLLAGKWMVSKGGGSVARWRHDGKELFYLAPDRSIMAVEILASGAGTNRSFQPGEPAPLFKGPPGLLFWDVSADGKRFLMPVPGNANSPAPYKVVLNWTATLKH